MNYFDLQVNGYRGVDFNGDSMTLEQVAEACRSLKSEGVEAILNLQNFSRISAELMQSTCRMPPESLQKFSRIPLEFQQNFSRIPGMFQQISINMFFFLFFRERWFN